MGGAPGETSPADWTGGRCVHTFDGLERVLGPAQRRAQFGQHGELGRLPDGPLPQQRLRLQQGRRQRAGLAFAGGGGATSSCSSSSTLLLLLQPLAAPVQTLQP